MIAHDRQRGSGIHHPASRVDGAQLCRTAVDEVSDEDGLPLRVTPGAGRVVIAKFAQQGFQLVGLPVDVADDVIAHDASLFDVRLKARSPFRPWDMGMACSRRDVSVNDFGAVALAPPRTCAGCSSR